MNFMTFDRVTSLFPALTFWRRIALPHRAVTSPNGVSSDWVLKLRDSGYQVPATPSQVDLSGSEYGINTRRHIRDAFCWQIEFGGKKIFFHSLSFIQMIHLDNPPPHPYKTRPVNSLTLKRKTFEVLDWTTSMTKTGAHIIIGEDFELR